MDENILPATSFRKKHFIVSVCVVVFLIIFYIFFYRAPSNFPTNSFVTINTGESLQNITLELYNDGIIRSPGLFRTTVIVLGGENKVIAGDYLISGKEGPFLLAYRLVHGIFQLSPVKITIPEGWNNAQIGDSLSKNIVDFDTKTFLTNAKQYEGYLFPDTYFLSPKSTPDVVIDRMRKNFDAKVATIAQIKTFGKSVHDLVIMASMLEDEARTTADRQIVAGILWKRLQMGLPLQVDSTIAYVTGKPLPNLSANDLKIKSPYNTYLNAGLPPGPIGNPGLDALTAAVTPTATSYLYYLSDKDGNMHYATTYEEHQRNIQKYLR